MQSIADWLISGSIGLFFGIISAWITYRYQRKRDDIAWAREKLKLQEQFAHEKELLERQLRDQVERQKESQLREALTRGIDDAAKEIKALEGFITLTAHSGGHLSPGSADDLRRLAQELLVKVNGVGSTLSAIDFQMHGIQSTNARHWQAKRSGLMLTLQDAIGASMVIQDIADDLDAR